jgi:hypothetical protein
MWETKEWLSLTWDSDAGFLKPRMRPELLDRAESLLINSWSGLLTDRKLPLCFFSWEPLPNELPKSLIDWRVAWGSAKDRDFDSCFLSSLN